MRKESLIATNTQRTVTPCGDLESILDDCLDFSTGSFLPCRQTKSVTVMCSSQEEMMKTCNDQGPTVSYLCRHVTVKTTPNHKFVFTVKTHHTVAPGSIAFSLPQVPTHTDTHTLTHY